MFTEVSRSWLSGLTSVSLGGQIGLEEVEKQVQLAHGLVETFAFHLWMRSRWPHVIQSGISQHVMRLFRACGLTLFIFGFCFGVFFLVNLGTHLGVSGVQGVNVKLLLAGEMVFL